MNFWDDIVNGVKGILGLGSDVGKGIALAAEAWVVLTDYRMWRSLGWLLLGIILMIMGLVMWAQRPIQGAAELLTKI